MTYIKDIGWLLLLGLLLPLLMALALASLLVVVTRHVYWWARGNTTAVSRHRGSSWSNWRPWSHDTKADRRTAPLPVVPRDAVPVPNR